MRCGSLGNSYATATCSGWIAICVFLLTGRVVFGARFQRPAALPGFPPDPRHPGDAQSGIDDRLLENYFVDWGCNLPKHPAIFDGDLRFGLPEATHSKFPNVLRKTPTTTRLFVTAPD